jgi:RNA polymerase sigma-70 factor (ECF subfamily)
MENQVLEFHDIYNDFHSRILRYISSLVGEHEAEDLTQEAFVKVSRGLENFRGECKLSTWLYRIATNVAIDRMRTSSFKLDAELSGLDDSDNIQDQAVWTGEEKHTVEQSLMHKEMVQCFIDHVKNLPSYYRTIVALSEVEELTNGEIAEILGLSLDVVKIRLHRGRTRLIQELKNNCKAEDWL